MKAGCYLIFFSLGLAVLAKAQPAELPSESKAQPSSSTVRGRIVELLKQDAMKAPQKPKEDAPFLNPGSIATDQPVTEGILELEPIVVTKQKPIELPLRTPKITLESFFYGDGKIFESAGKRFSISAGPEGNGLAAIKFSIKF